MAQTNPQRESGTHPPVADQSPRTSGIVLHSPIRYDFTVWLAFLGKERAFRDKVLELARLLLRAGSTLVPSAAAEQLMVPVEVAMLGCETPRKSTKVDGLTSRRRSRISKQRETTWRIAANPPIPELMLVTA